MKIMSDRSWLGWNTPLIALVTLCLLACNPGTKAPSPAEGSTPVAGKQDRGTEAPTGKRALTLKKKELKKAAEANRVESLMNASGRKVKRSEKVVTPERLEKLGAASYQTYLSQDPELHVFIFNYEPDSLSRKSIQDLVLWINESGLVHNAEAAMARNKIVAIGFPTTDPPTEDMIQARNDLMDSVVAGR